MHRLLVEAELLDEERPTLPTGAARHLRVLRPRVGEEIELFDGRGRCRVFKVGDAEPDRAGCLVSDSEIFTLPRPALNLTLFACVTKGSRWDWTVEKATELGVARIVPVLSSRTIVRIPKSDRTVKRERWMRIAEDAARQSDAKWLPEIVEPLDFGDALSLVRETTCFVGALTDPPSPPLVRAIAARGKCERPAVFVGPEGDFTPEELAELMAIAIPTSFGPTVLRAETAAIYAVSVLVAQASGRAEP